MGIRNSSPKKPEEKELTVQEKAMLQFDVKRILNNEKFAFRQPEIDAVLAIPITNFHTYLTYREVSQIIHKNLPEMSEGLCVRMAKAITDGKTVKDPRAR